MTEQNDTGKKPARHKTAPPGEAGTQAPARQVHAERVQSEESTCGHVLDAIPIGIHLYEIQEDGRLLFIAANPAADRILKIRHDQFIGKPIEEAFPSAKNTGIIERYKTVALHGEPWQKQGIFYEDERIRGAFDVYAFQVSSGRVAAAFADVSARAETEKHLRESEEKFRILADESLVGVYLIQDGLFRYVNPRMAEIFGYRPDELIGERGPRDLTSPGDWPMVQEYIRKRISGEVKALQYTFRGLSKEKKELFIEVYGARITYQDRPAIIGTLIDVTERKRLEQALGQSEERFRALFEQSAVGISIVDLERKIIDVNAAMERMLGYGEGELRERNIAEISHTGDDEENKQLFRQMMEKGKDHFSMEKRYLKKDGSILWGRLTVSLVRDGGGTPAFMVGIVEDITERMQVEITAGESEERFRQLSEAAFDGISITEAGVFREVNDSFARMFGYDPGEIPGLSVKDLVAPEYHEDVMGKILSGYDKPYESVCMRKDGSMFPVEVCGKTFSSKGENLRITAVRDISDRKAMEEELLRREKLESLGVLAGGIAHDFNNLLTAVLGNVSLSKAYVGRDSKAYSRLEEAEKAVARARDLTQQLLTFSRGGTPVKSRIAIGRTVAESAELALRGSPSRCLFTIPDNLWPVEADEGQIGQVINNLVINAAQAMPEGGTIAIGCRNVTVEDYDELPLSRGRYVEISVRDEGIGIPGEYLSKIFDPYFTTKQTGSGLGLASVHSIVKKHDGFIRVESTLGSGTSFLIYLPAAEGPLVPGRYDEPATVPGSGRVLVMDDEEIVREIATEMLRNLGYDVECAHDGAEALKLFRKALKGGEPFDIVLMDLTVPGGLGGKETIREMREIDPAVRAIVSSGYSNDPIMSDFGEYGFSGMISKPYKLGELSRVLRAASPGPGTTQGEKE